MGKLKKTKTSVIIIALLMSVYPLFSQKKKDSISDEYRRSSLHIILLESDNFLNKELVMNAYNAAPFPDKYNDHRLSESMFNPKDYIIGKTDEPEIDQEIDQPEDTTAQVQEESSGKADKKMPAIIERYINEKNIAAQLVAKWFNRKDNGAFDMDLIFDRGSYDATVFAAETAKQTVRGSAMLKDAGEDLISNTFVVVNRMFYIKNEIAATIVREAAYIAAGKISNSMLQEAAKIAADQVYKSTKDGYSVWTTSYLYQLDWNEEIANTFYMDMWMDSTSIDPAIKERFDTTTMFKMKYIGFAKAKSLVLIGEGKEEAFVIQQATIRNIDKVYTKLQKAFDVFKTKTPIFSADPLMAKIGLKEGIEPNDKFEVLEQMMDQKTGLTRYVQVGTVKVDKANIWDNRYNMEELAGEDDGAGNKEIQGTYFKGGGKKIQPGMLLRLVK